MPSRFIVSFFVIVLSGIAASAEDWPMWRGDAARSGGTTKALPEPLHLQWVRQLPLPRPAWPASQGNLQFDAVPQPIVVGNRVIVGSTADDSVVAFETATGRECWRFFTGGPIRFAPAAWNGKIYVASDDGCLYCLDADQGSLCWQARGGPRDRKVIGNDRLISSWPIRGGPVVVDGVVYFTAGIWPFMGIFVHALDAETGETIWVNSETGSRWVTHPHGAPSFGSIVPQGYLSVSGKHLIVPGGRSLPAVFDRHSGELLHFEFGGKGAGGWHVVAHDDFYVVGDTAFLISDGSSAGRFPIDVFTDGLVMHESTAHLINRESFGRIETKDRRGKTVSQLSLRPHRSWQVMPDGWTTMLLAGQHAFAAAQKEIGRFELPATGQHEPAGRSPSWSTQVDDKIAGMIAGNQRLLVTTVDARLYCFGREDTEVVRHDLRTKPTTAGLHRGEASALVQQIIDRHQVQGGWAVVWGIGTGAMIDALLADSDLSLIVVDPDADAVDRFRRRMLADGMYGSRVTAHVGSVDSFAMPPYLAEVVIGEDVSEWDVTGDVAAKVVRSLRPYTGAAYLNLSKPQHETFTAGLSESNEANIDVSRAGDFTTVRRTGALAGAGQWTHQYADATNSVVSQDTLVRAPLGLLWFGGPSNDRVLPRHGHGPSPQVAGGRLVIEGADMLRSVDVYTGRVFWEKELPGLGTYYDTTRHFAGAGEIGSNYVTLPDAVYVVYGAKILKLDAATGATLDEFTHRTNNESPPVAWGYLAVSGDKLIATAGPVAVTGNKLDRRDRQLADVLSPVDYSSASRHLLVLDRHTGKLLWSRTAELNFRHNCIAIGDGKVFCIDRMTDAKLAELKRRGIEPAATPRLLALELQTGAEIWSTDEHVFGTFLNYSVEHDVLLQAGSAYRDRARDEVRVGMTAFRGRTGQLLWQDLSRGHGGPCLMWQDKIITNGGGGSMFELLTGDPVPWKYSRMYGCNTAVGSQHLLTFRSGAAGFCDLAGDSGTGNIGGFRSSCTANLIVADGVLNAPDYTRTCTCAYQNQCSLALIHDPDAEMWTFSSLGTAPDQFGINFGAPGDRRAADGRLWFDYPAVGGHSPTLPVEVAGSEIRYLQQHATTIAASPSGHLPWVASSCAIGVTEIELTAEIDSTAERRLAVQLYFSELAGAAAGERVFDVTVNDQVVLKDFDIVRAAGGANRAVMKEFPVAAAAGKYKIRFTPRAGQPCISGIAIVGE